MENDLKFYEELPFTTLFVDGNHENFTLLNQYPVTTWNGGKVHKISDHVYHLMRGQVFEMEGKTFFTFGGADSRDKRMRIENVSWWKEERPTEEEIAEAKFNLMRYNNTVDYVITHCPPAYVTNFLYRRSLMRKKFGELKYKCERNSCDYLLEDILKKTREVKAYINGHEHVDEMINLMRRKHILLFNNIIELL